jgi:hypothetical protein
MPVCKTSGKCPVNKVGDKMMADDPKMTKNEEPDKSGLDLIKDPKVCR